MEPEDESHREALALRDLERQDNEHAAKINEMARLGSAISRSSHYKHFLQRVQKPALQRAVRSQIQSNNILGENMKALLEDDEADLEETVGLYEKRRDPAVVSPDTLKDIKECIQDAALYHVLLNEQDLERIEEVPEDSEEEGPSHEISDMEEVLDTI